MITTTQVGKAKRHNQCYSNIQPKMNIKTKEVTHVIQLNDTSYSINQKSARNHREYALWTHS